MRKGVPIVSLLPVVLALGLTAARASDTAAWFAEAIRLDEEGKADQAFALFRRAAEAGMSQAEFNVAVMLDSGRGVERDVAQSATWYARAAARGNARAAYNLGQLYEAGQGVPRNLDAARTWFAASGLNAARARLAALPPRDPGQEQLSAPVPVTPSGAAAPAPEGIGLELVWTSEPQPEPVNYFVELRAVSPSGSREIFSTSVPTTSTLADVSLTPGDYTWRVFAIGRRAQSYAASPWTRFTVRAD